MNYFAQNNYHLLWLKDNCHILTVLTPHLVYPIPDNSKRMRTISRFSNKRQHNQDGHQSSFQLSSSLKLSIWSTNFRTHQKKQKLQKYIKQVNCAHIRTLLLHCLWQGLNNNKQKKPILVKWEITIRQWLPLDSPSGGIITYYDGNRYPMQPATMMKRGKKENKTKSSSPWFY